MGVIHFANEQDTVELVKALAEEGYRAELGPGDEDSAAVIVSVEPFDERVVEMVDVYGGWIPGDVQLPE